MKGGERCLNIKATNMFNHEFLILMKIQDLQTHSMGNMHWLLYSCFHGADLLHIPTEAGTHCSLIAMSLHSLLGTRQIQPPADF